MNPLFAVLLDEPSPLVTRNPWSYAVPVYPCPYFTRGSVTVKLVVSTVVVVPLTVKFPVTVALPETVRLSATVVSEVPCPIVIAVPDIPVPIETDSLEFAVSIIRYASEPCLIVRAVAELSLTATLISVPSALIESIAISPTLVMSASLKLVAPKVLAAAVDVIPAAAVIPPPSAMVIELSPSVYPILAV